MGSAPRRLAPPSPTRYGPAAARRPSPTRNSLLRVAHPGDPVPHSLRRGRTLNYPNHDRPQADRAGRFSGRPEGRAPVGVRRSRRRSSTSSAPLRRCSGGNGRSGRAPRCLVRAPASAPCASAPQRSRAEPLPRAGLRSGRSGTAPRRRRPASRCLRARSSRPRSTARPPPPRPRPGSGSAHGCDCRREPAP